MRIEDVGPLRLRNQRLVGPPFATPAEAVGALGAMQSQEFPVAQWSIAQRTRGVTKAALDRAFAEGAILRTHVLRPTWHFVLPADIRWMMELTAPRIRAFGAFFDRQLELDDAVFRKSHALMRKALARGEHLTRKELAAVLERGGIVAVGQRLGQLMMRAELDLVVCSGAPREKLHTYALVEQRAPRARSLPREEALAELTRRYFQGHGPATRKDYMWWSSLTAADCQRGIEANAGRLEREVVEGRTYWFAPPLPRPRIASPALHLLQGYDEYVIAYTESKDALSIGGVAGAAPRSQTGFLHAVVLGGQVVGHWRRALGDVTTIEARLSRPLHDAEERALRAEVARYGRFIGTKAALRRVVA